jgi:N-acetylglucosamine-6-phosphate deacetylase
LPDRLLIRHGTLVFPSGPVRADVLCGDGRIVAISREIGAEGAAELDASGLTLGPGFVDVHVHGGGGHSFFTRDPTRIAAYRAWAPRNGVTSFLVSTVGRNAEETVVGLQGLAPAIGPGDGAEPLGFHLEGPFINPVRKGAFEAGTLRSPAIEEWQRFQEAAGGRIRQVTVAPELPGALALIRAMAASGALPAMGHTDATGAQAREGFAAGIGHVTHLFNAMRPLHQREGGPAVAALLDDSVTCELICDGAHLAPEIIRLAYRVLGPTRTVVVTDNLDIAGTDTARSSFAAHRVTVSGAVAARDDGTIVGSVATMDQHFRNVFLFLDLDLATAFRLCSTNPSRVAGVLHRKGVIEHGLDADLVMLDDALEVVATVCRGVVAYCREPGRGAPTS